MKFVSHRRAADGRPRMPNEKHAHVLRRGRAGALILGLAAAAA